MNDDDGGAKAGSGGAKVRPNLARDTSTPRPSTRSSTASHRIRWADDSPLDSDDARGRIVAAALDCVRRFGADKTGMDDVAKAAAITRTTVYKYFGSRNELLMAVFLRVLDSKLERGLADFFSGADSVEALHDGVADASVFILGKLRGDEAIEAILYDSRLPIEDLLTGAASMLVEVMQVAFGNVLAVAIDPSLAEAMRPLDVERAAEWVIRLLYTFLVWPMADPAQEREQFRQFLAPAFFRDPS